MTIRLYLDEDVRPLLATVLRSRGYDVLTAAEAGRTGEPDLNQLEYAASEGRAFVTHNIRDFQRLAKEYGQQGLRHGGIVFAPQMPFKDLLRLTLRMLSQVGEEAFQDRVEWLTRFHG
ncbi:MAG TPA: hypothetical protein DEQ28_04425 [Clostridiales bacterium]|nr:hypothetical protein [Clostridiales bacterium]